MATYGKPTTGFYVNYGEATAAVVTSSLAPVLIAPRYKLHKMDAGFADARLVEVDAAGVAVNTDSPTYPLIDNNNILPWPGRTDDSSIVDITSAKLFAGNCSVVLNNDAMSGAVRANATNCLVMAEGVQLGGAAGLSKQLRGHEVLAGDIVALTSGTSTVYASVVDVQPDKATGYTLTESKVILASDAGSVEDITVDVSAFTGDADCSYLIKVKDAQGTVEISSLSGDAGYLRNPEITGTIALGSFGATVKINTVTNGGSYIVRITAQTVNMLNAVYLDCAVEAGTYTDIYFASARIAPGSVAIPAAYWELNEAGIRVTNDIQISIGSMQYKLHSAELYLDYRELLVEDSLELRTNQISNIAEWVGPVHPDNPMGMMYAAASQAGGALIYLVATDGDTEEATVKAINYAGQYESAYAVIPYMQTPVTQAAVIAVLNKYAIPTVAQFKHAWFCTTSGSETTVYAEEEGEALLGDIKLKANKLTLTLVGDTADLLKARVKAGDYAVVIGGYHEDTGKYDEHSYKITRVVGTNSVELANGKIHGISRVYFKRVLGGSEYAAKLADEARAINNYHVNFVVSDALNFAGFENVNPVYLCATLAAMRSVLPPHAPMNELTVPGFSITNTMKWTDDDYETMNNGGAWVVARNAEGNLVTFHQITTRTDGTVAEEDSVVSNAESIVRQLRLAVRPYASGKCNVTQTLLNEIKTALITTIMQIQRENYDASYGQRILDFDLPVLEIPEGNERSVVCYCNIDLPQPLQDGAFYFNLF